MDYVNSNEILKGATESWKKFDEYKYFFFSDEEQDAFMRDRFSDIYDAYQKLPLAVINGVLSVSLSRLE